MVLRGLPGERFPVGEIVFIGDTGDDIDDVEADSKSALLPY